MVAVQLIESPNIILLQTEINKFLEGIDKSFDLIDDPRRERCIKVLVFTAFFPRMTKYLQ